MTNSSDAVIQTVDLTYRYGKFTAIQDVNLQVKRGEIFGFLGPNGAGKTTTIRTLLDFLRPSEGSATIFGLDTRQDSVAIRQRIGYLPSELTLLNNWTGVQYVRWLENLRGANNGYLAEAQRLAEHLDYDLSRSLKGLSTGMKRKMGLIAAMLHKPELLILDEPTNGLDPLMQQVFHELVKEARDEGRTVFLSSHNLAEVEDICDRVGIIRTGRMEAVETVTNLTRVTFRWLVLTLDEAASLDVAAIADGFSAIQGVTEVEARGSELRMRVSGHVDMNAVIKCAAQVAVADININYPTLEEIFLAYYGKKEA